MTKIKDPCLSGRQEKSKIKNTNKKLIIIILMLVLALSIIKVDKVSFAEDKIMAIVNNEVITQKDLNDFLNFTRMQLSREYKGKELEEKIQALQVDLRDKLIADRLILQEAKKEKIQVDDARVKSRILEVKKRYPTEADFQKDLSRQGMVQADIEVKIKEQMQTYYIIEQKVRSKIAVRPEEVTSYYNQNKDSLIAPEERQLEIILLENKDMASFFALDYRSGKSLEDLATNYVFQVDKLSAIKAEGLRKDIEDVVFKLSLGEVSDPVAIDGKYYVFKLEDILPAHQLSLRDSQERINSVLFDSKMQEQMAKWLDELKKQSYINILQN